MGASACFVRTLWRPRTDLRAPCEIELSLTTGLVSRYGCLDLGAELGHAAGPSNQATRRRPAFDPRGFSIRIAVPVERDLLASRRRVTAYGAAALNTFPSTAEFDDEIAAAAEIQKLGEQLLAAYEPDPAVPNHFVIPAFVSRAVQASRGVCLLADAGFEGEAFAAMRTVVELSIDLGCIARDPSLLPQFVAAGLKKEKHNLEGLNTLARANLRPERASQLKAVIATLPGESWSTLSVEERARRADRDDFTVTAYAEGSRACHSNFASLQYAHTVENGRIFWKPDVTRRNAIPVLWSNVLLGLLLLDAAAFLKDREIAMLARLCCTRCGLRAAKVFDEA